MFCPKCGTRNEEEARFCVSCGNSLASQGGFQPQPAARPAGDPFAWADPSGPVPNYLPHAIVTTLLCCMPFGIVSIVYAAQVNSKVLAGDIQGARESSENAKKWAIISAVLGIIPMGFFLMMFMGGLASSF